jgi:hypothetical protein
MQPYNIAVAEQSSTENQVHSAIAKIDQYVTQIISLFSTQLKFIDTATLQKEEKTTKSPLDKAMELATQIRQTWNTINCTSNQYPELVATFFETLTTKFMLPVANIISQLYEYEDRTLQKIHKSSFFPNINILLYDPQEMDVVENIILLLGTAQNSADAQYKNLFAINYNITLARWYQLRYFVSGNKQNLETSLQTWKNTKEMLNYSNIDVDNFPSVFFAFCNITAILKKHLQHLVHNSKSLIPRQLHFFATTTAFIRNFAKKDPWKNIFSLILATTYHRALSEYLDETDPFGNPNTHLKSLQENIVHSLTPEIFRQACGSVIIKYILKCWDNSWYNLLDDRIFQIVVEKKVFSKDNPPLMFAIELVLANILTEQHWVIGSDLCSIILSDMTTLDITKQQLKLLYLKATFFSLHAYLSTTNNTNHIKTVPTTFYSLAKGYYDSFKAISLQLTSENEKQMLLFCEKHLMHHATTTPQVEHKM